MTEAVRVLLADDHGVVRAGLEQLLRTYRDVDVVGSAADGREAVALSAELRPDVVLMDLSMPEVDGVEAIRRIVGASPECHCVAFTSFSEHDRIIAALDAGAVGYLMKDADPEELHRGILAAARGESPLAPKAAQALLSERADRRPSQELSEREREVLTLVVEGYANKQIARRLGISDKTVKAHLTSVFQRIGVSDRTQAALWAERHGLTREPPAGS